MKKKLDRGCRVLLALAALLAAAPGTAWSEQAVGLEAQGLSPWAALRPGGLDVRDELGRPVRAEVIEAQVKAANARAAAQAGYASRLPKAETIIRLLELMEALKTWLSPSFPLPESRPLWALAPAAPGPHRFLLLCLLACLPLALAGHLRFHGHSFLPRAACGAVVVLRC